MSRWHSNREVTVNTFDRHDFAFKWSFAEMSPLTAGVGYDWGLRQTSKCIGELVDLLRPDAANTGSDAQPARLFAEPTFTPPEVSITCRSATDLQHTDDAFVDLVVMD